MRVPCSERVSFLFAEKGYLEVDGHAVVLRQGSDLIHFPVGATCVIFIEPGCVVTHAAVKACAKAGCLLIWVGESGVRLYAAGIQWGKSYSNILRQSKIRLDENLRLKAAARVFSIMFGESPPAHRTIDQLRGMEGYRVKTWYKETATKLNLNWTGRDQRSALSDPLNRAISSANAALYGISEAVIISLGYSPAIGIVHSGDRRSFVFDVADTVKFNFLLPHIMAAYADGKITSESDSRKECRDVFKKGDILHKIVMNIERIING